MGVWQEPKTNWSGASDEFFNVQPDYQRIKGNIEYLYELSLKLFPTYTIYELENVTYKSIPYVDFFNNIVYNIDLIANNSVRPLGYQTMRTYSENMSIWSYKDLNIIENNIKVLKDELQKRYDMLNQLPVMLGIREEF
jgi:hypothetical protein